MGRLPTLLLTIPALLLLMLVARAGEGGSSIEIDGFEQLKKAKGTVIAEGPYTLAKGWSLTRPGITLFMFSAQGNAGVPNSAPYFPKKPGRWEIRLEGVPANTYTVYAVMHLVNEKGKKIEVNTKPMTYTATE